jgi:mannose-1-phosphate guanylyltransferase/mannose-6-phosphate isomerase
MKILPVLLAGGSGTRLWPLSRELYPKQFLSLVDERSLLQNTAARAAAIPGALPPVVICNEQHRFLVAEQLQEIGAKGAAILLEPEGRNTAPAAAAAAHFAVEHHGDDTLVFLMAADNAIADTDAFAAAAAIAAQAAAQGRIVTFGIEPKYPETGYGYLKAGQPLGNGAFDVAEFIEKPDLAKATALLAAGGVFWNGGMFLFAAKTFLAELKRLEPAMHDAALTSLQKAKRDIDFIRLDGASFKSCRSESIDYAVMEKSRAVALVPLDAGWDDVGSWSFMGRLAGADADGNIVRGDVMLEGSSGNLVHAARRLVTLVGVRDHIVIETDDAVLISTKDRVQDVKAVVQKLKAAKRSEAQTHPRVFRPWGSYETIALGARFQVKRIIVKPGHKLSLQMHHHRAEHWIVVSGTARVTCGDKEFLLREDESTYIPLGTRHRLENPGKVGLELIEVQSGAYLGEDDIVRFDDVYGRIEDGKKA